VRVGPGAAGYAAAPTVEGNTDVYIQRHARFVFAVAQLFGHRA
jgi:hypothetical protein